jgi:LysM repeat protein
MGIKSHYNCTLYYLTGCSNLHIITKVDDNKRMKKRAILLFSGFLLLAAACGPNRLYSAPSVPTSFWLLPTLGATTTPVPTQNRKPTPTWTPTVTPTPVVYTVKKGDVLGGIALEYSVSLEALMLANGLENAHLLSIGQKLVIPNDAMLEDMARRGLDVKYVTPTPVFPTPTLRPSSIAWDQASKLIGKEVSLEGRVIRTRKAGGAVYLYFQERTEGAFCIYIPAAEARNLATQPEVYYLDHWILVKGIIEEADSNLQITVNKRAQISVLE